jgi:hypothetical protein
MVAFFLWQLCRKWPHQGTAAATTSSTLPHCWQQLPAGSLQVLLTAEVPQVLLVMVVMVAGIWFWWWWQSWRWYGAQVGVARHLSGTGRMARSSLAGLACGRQFLTRRVDGPLPEDHYQLWWLFGVCVCTAR